MVASKTQHLVRIAHGAKNICLFPQILCLHLNRYYLLLGNRVLIL